MGPHSSQGPQWWGRLFKILITSVKQCLRKAIGRACLSFEESLTTVIEVEMVINSCPLTYISSDDLDDNRTPSHLLIRHRVMNLPDQLCGKNSDINVDRAILGKRAKHLNHVLNRFWKRWRNEYLLELRNSHSQARPRHSQSLERIRFWLKY